MEDFIGEIKEPKLAMRRQIRNRIGMKNAQKRTMTNLSMIIKSLLDNKGLVLK